MVIPTAKSVHPKFSIICSRTLPKAWYWKESRSRPTASDSNSPSMESTSL